MKIIDESEVEQYLSRKKQPLIWDNSPKCQLAAQIAAEIYENIQERKKKEESQSA